MKIGPFILATSMSSSGVGVAMRKLLEQFVCAVECPLVRTTSVTR